MNGHSSDCSAIDTCIIVDEKITRQSTDSYQDNNNETIAKQSNECVICFEPVTDLNEISKAFSRLLVAASVVLTFALTDTNIPM